MGTVFLYAGQGSQRVGMGKDFYDGYETYRNFIDSLTLDFDIKELMHEGPEDKLSLTEYTQPCMAAFAAGVTALLKENGVTPDAACGLSLGEYGALHAAGVFDAKTFVDLVAYRGKVMADAAKGLECSMSAILGTDSQTIEEACRAYEGDDYVTVANYNCPGQTVICGDESAVAAVEEVLKEKGAKRCVRLKVSGPFHTKYMAPAADLLGERLAEISLKAPSIPVSANVTGDFYQDGDDIRGILMRQIQSSVRLEDDLKKLLEAGYTDFIEIGPGNTMSGFLKKTARAAGAKVTIRGIDKAEDLEKIIAG
ncbi:MAG: ACP S-malonyltransferase [Lachnospiraceae bacterium]|nr:ACP S-malonyltransferase [Lachnospiraceae bacterium]